MLFCAHFQLNVAENCIDRHLIDRADDIALVYEADSTQDGFKVTYQGLHDEVCRLANTLKTYGVVKGDTVCIYMPMTPSVVYAMLACARIGAIHSVVFAGFSAEALRARIVAANSKVVITADEVRYLDLWLYFHPFSLSSDTLTHPLRTPTHVHMHSDMLTLLCTRI